MHKRRAALQKQGSALLGHVSALQGHVSAAQGHVSASLGHVSAALGPVSALQKRLHRASKRPRFACLRNPSPRAQSFSALFVMGWFNSRISSAWCASSSRLGASAPLSCFALNRFAEQKNKIVGADKYFPRASVKALHAKGARAN